MLLFSCIHNDIHWFRSLTARGSTNKNNFYDFHFYDIVMITLFPALTEFGDNLVSNFETYAIRRKIEVHSDNTGACAMLFASDLGFVDMFDFVFMAC